MTDGLPGFSLSRVRTNAVGAPVLRCLQGWEQSKHTAKAFELTCTRRLAIIPESLFSQGTEADLRMTATFRPLVQIANLAIFDIHG
jgi:hypothetical protein